LLKNSKCSESLQIKRERRPRRCEPNATHLGSNGRREREISRLFKMANRQKKGVLTVQSVHDVVGRTDDVADRTDDVAGHTLTWQTVGILRVLLAANGDATRGPITSRHVSLMCWLKLCTQPESTP
jgi:hypothetical protein